MATCLLGAHSAEKYHPSRKGKDFALFFAVDTYEDPYWEDLRNPVRDAEAIAEELEMYFGFETELHVNPNFVEIYAEIQKWQNKNFDEDAQLFIFFSGHGGVNDVDGEGYFMPTNADSKITNHLSLLSLRLAVEKIPCKHILLAVDACYSGSILDSYRAPEQYTPETRRLGESEEARKRRIINRELTYKSRFILTSGGRERTLDGINHSPFTEGLLNTFSQSLRKDGIMIWEELVSQMVLRVNNPRPRYGKFEGHREGGGFVFVRSVQDPINEILMVSIDGGKFKMGNNKGRQNEKPEHNIKLTDFSISEKEITNAQYCRFLNDIGNQLEGGEPWINLDTDLVLIEKVGDNFKPKSGKEDHPVNCVSWFGAKAFCEWFSEQYEGTYRLPTEAEWEYAASGGNAARTLYCGTNNKDAILTFANVNGQVIAKVGSKEPNLIGLFDMGGNVWEWCEDGYEQSYYDQLSRQGTVENPLYSGYSEKYIIKGGAWNSKNMDYLRVSFRNSMRPQVHLGNGGFRVVREGN